MFVATTIVAVRRLACAGRPQQEGRYRAVRAEGRVGGRCGLALALARQLPCEIISMDSAQVYIGMDIGTAKPTPAEQAEVRHHLIDVVDPWEPFEVHSFQRAVADAPPARRHPGGGAAPPSRPAEGFS